VIEYVGLIIPTFGFLITVTFIFIVVTLLAGIWNTLGKFGVSVPKIIRR
jgi:hypothetical protein